jgi:hypothetical protein
MRLCIWKEAMLEAKEVTELLGKDGSRLLRLISLLQRAFSRSFLRQGEPLRSQEGA